MHLKLVFFGRFDGRRKKVGRFWNVEAAEKTKLRTKMDGIEIFKREIEV